MVADNNGRSDVGSDVVSDGGFHFSRRQMFSHFTVEKLRNVGSTVAKLFFAF
jgi:hypothetical protein